MVEVSGEGDFPVTDTQRFDLTAVRDQDAQSSTNRFNRIMGWAFAGLGLALVAIGIVRGFVEPTARTLEDYVAFGVVIVTGLGIVAVVLVYPATPARAPDTLEIATIGLSFGRRLSDDWTHLEWADPNLNLLLFDRSRLPPRKPDPHAVFVLLARGRRVPLTRPAFEAILQEAQRHNMSITRSEAPGGLVPGVVEILTIRQQA